MTYDGARFVITDADVACYIEPASIYWMSLSVPAGANSWS